MIPDSEDNQFEAILRDLPLKQPRRSLDERVRQAAGGPSEARAARRLRAWAAAGGVAAALAAAAMWVAGGPSKPPADPPPTAARPSAPPPPQAGGPIRIREVRSDWVPRGLIVLDDGASFHGVEERRFERVQLIDEEKNIRIEYAVPTTEMLLLPLEYD